MAARSRFSTSTVIDSEYLVPWLSAEEPLSYSPAKPPARDYFFQYTWILPGIFNPQVNLREHRYFGSPLKDSARFLFDFWANARRDQPTIPAGEVLLYRGIGQATRFRCVRFRPEELSPANGEIWRKYLRVQADMLSDSILSFNTIH
jgi:hypothetical protein